MKSVERNVCFVRLHIHLKLNNVVNNGAVIDCVRITNALRKSLDELGFYPSSTYSIVHEEHIHHRDYPLLTARGHCLYYSGHVITLRVELLNFTFCSIIGESNRKHFVRVNLFSRTAENKSERSRFKWTGTKNGFLKLHSLLAFSEIFRETLNHSLRLEQPAGETSCLHKPVV